MRGIEAAAGMLYTFRMQMPFIGRELHLEACRSVLARDDDRARVITVTAPPGLGKSAFARRVLEIGEAQGWSVYTASLAEGRDDPPLHAWALVLQALRIDLGDDDGASSLFSALYGAWDAVPDAAGVDEANRKHVLFHMIGTFLGRAAKSRRILVCLDNTHLCDASSLTLARYLLETLPRCPLAFLLTLRPREAAERSEILELLDTLRLYPAWQDVRLSELTPTEIRATYDGLRAERPDLPDCDTLIRATGGNPLRLTALLLGRAGVQGAESPLEGLWRRYHGRFDGRAGRLLEALSLLGNHFAPIEANAAAEAIEERDLTGLLDDALYHGLLERDGDGYSFLHDDFRLLILNSLSQSDRARLRDRLIERLRDTPSRDGETASIRLAGLYVDADDSPEREAHLSAAAAILEGRGAWKEGARYYEAVAAAAERRGDETARDRALIGAVRCFGGEVDHTELFRLVPRLATHLVERDDIESMRELMNVNPYIYWGAVLLIRPIVTRLLEVTPESDPRWPLLVLWTNSTSPAGRDGFNEQVRQVDSIAERILTSGSDQDRWVLHRARANIARMRKQVDEALSELERASELPGSRFRYDHLYEQAKLCFFTAPGEKWRTVVSRAEEISRVTQIPVVREAAEGFLQRRYLYDGDFQNVLAFGEDEGEFQLDFRIPPRVLAYRWMGNEAAARKIAGLVVHKVNTDYRSNGMPWAVAPVAWLLSIDALFTGSDQDHDLIVEGVRYQRGLTQDGMIHQQHVLISAGRICDRTWTDDECREMYEELVGYDEFYLDEEIHSVEIAKAMFADRLGRPDDALAHYEAAIAWCERVEELPWRSWVWAKLAERGVDGARENALEIATRIGNVHVLTMLGEAPHAEGARTPDGPLSARETEVMDLAAKGYTDREIGGYLNISEHTVANHLRKIFRKLGASNRVEATRIAIDEHIIPAG